LQVIKEFLERTLTGVSVREARVVRPLVLRDLSGAGFEKDVAGRAFTGFWRKGKLLGMELGGAEPKTVVVNPMLSGGLRYCDPSERMSKSTFVVLRLSNEKEMRYFDDDQMGAFYYLAPQQVAEVPRLLEQGPDVLDAPMDLPEFDAALKRFRGEVKGVLTRGELVEGIGNAYADEVCFAAAIFPFCKATSLKAEEVERLWRAVYGVPREAVPVLRERVGEHIHLKVRDFLKVHGRGGQPCPRCGGRVSEIRANGRLHNYCRTCQPGSLFGAEAMAGRSDGGGGPMETRRFSGSV
jgi:formamidopyrimidine-DNA glycosylase